MVLFLVCSAGALEAPRAGSLNGGQNLYLSLRRVVLLVK